ncbi:MAG: hypothetical protein ACLGXA_24450 [Acidobacteriota bacterium]
MARLNAEDRKRLRSSSFALPDKREFPIEDREHGEKALQLLPNSDTTPAEKARVRAAVHRKFPTMGKN